jgi:hypothetical protein
VNGITDWVTNLMDPILDDEDRINEVLAAAKKRPTDIQKLKRYMHSQGDLVYGSMFPETDIDILIAVVMRFLQDHIFQKILCGAMPEVVEVLTFAEGSMQNNVEPRRGTALSHPFVPTRHADQRHRSLRAALMASRGPQRRHLLPRLSESTARADQRADRGGGDPVQGV